MSAKELLISLDKIYDIDTYNSIYENVRKMGGVSFINIFKRSGVIKIIYDDAAVTSEKIISRITSFNVGIKNSLVKEQFIDVLEKEYIFYFHKIIFILIMFIIYYYSEKFGTNVYISFILYPLIIIGLVRDFYIRYQQSLKRVNIYLVSIFYLVSFFIYKLLSLIFPGMFNYNLVGWDKFIFLILIISIGFYVSQYLLARSRNLINVKSFMPSFVKLKLENDYKNIDLKSIKENDIVFFAKGDFVSCDAIICSGSCVVDESLVKGKGEALSKVVDDLLYAGSFIIDGVVNARVLKKPEESTFFKFINSAASTNRFSFDFYNIPFIIFERYIFFVFVIAFLFIFLFINGYLKLDFIDTIFVPIFVLYPFLIWVLFPIIYIFSTTSGMKRGFSIKNVGIINAVVNTDTIIFFYDEGIDPFSILELRRIGLKTILVTVSKNVDKNLIDCFDECYLGVNDEEKEGFALRMKLSKNKIIAVGNSSSDLLALGVCDVSVMIMKHPESFSLPCDIILFKNDTNLILNLRHYSEFVIRIMNRNSKLIVLFHFFILPSLVIISVLFKKFIILDIIFIATILMLFSIIINSAKLYTFSKSS